MNRWTVLFATMLLTAFVVIGCSGDGTGPVNLDSDPGLTSGAQGQSDSTKTYLWAYYDVTIDPVTQQVTAVPNRSTLFAANVVTFLNSNPAAMIFGMNNLDVEIDKVIVDIDVELSHPFDGMPQFNGYDVRGIFMGGHSDTLNYNSDLDFAVHGVDQYMMNDPVELDGGGPDGFTRWFNAQEFKTPGMFGYTPGAFASKNFVPTATLNPYKYFADGIDIEDDPFEFLMANADDNGVFATGQSNERNYYLEFPLPLPGATYGYAVVANWEAPETHPANCPESPAISVTVTDNVYYVDESDNGGDLILTFDIWSWLEQPTAIIIESDVMSVPHTLDSGEMVPIGGGDHYSTYHVEIPADNVGYNSIDTGDSFYWVICEADGHDYTCDGYNPTGPTDTLAAVFGYPLFIANEPYNADPICDMFIENPTMPYEGYDEVDVTIDATASYDPDGETITWEWDFDGDDIYDEDPDDAYTGDPDHPTHTYTDDYVGEACARLTDGVGGETVCCVDIDIDLETSIFYYWDGEADGEGNMSECGNGMWAYMSSPYYCWDENGSQGYYSNNMCTVFYTEPFDVPSGLPNLHIEIKHWGRSEAYYDGGVMGYTLNGTTFTWHHPGNTIFTYSSGTNFNSTTYLFGAYYQSCCGFSGLPYYNWTQRAWANYTQWGSYTNPATSDFTFNGMIGTDDLRMAFGFVTDSSVTYSPGWSIRSIKVYFVP